MYYLLSKANGHASANAFLLDLIDQVDVGPASTLLARAALTFGFRDTEDAMQAVVAEALAADVIITRNIADFGASTIPARTPEDFLSETGIAPRTE